MEKNEKKGKKKKKRRININRIHSGHPVLQMDRKGKFMCPSNVRQDQPKKNWGQWSATLHQVCTLGPQSPPLQGWVVN